MGTAYHAKGNGVSGVNWNLVLNILLGSVQSTALPEAGSKKWSPTLFNLGKEIKN